MSTKVGCSLIALMLAVNAILVCLVMNNHEQLAQRENRAVTRLFRNEADFSAGLIKSSLEQKGRALAEQLGAILAEEMGAAGQARLGRILDKTFLDPDMRSARVEDPTGRVLCARRAPGGEPEQESDLKIILPLTAGDQNLGQLVVGVSTEPSEQINSTLESHFDWVLAILANMNLIHKNHVRASLVLITFGCTALLALILHWLIRRLVVKRLARLSTACGEIASGKLDRQIPLQGKDEIGRLALAFNKMTRALHSARAELIEQNDNLETKVAERTAALDRALARAEDASKAKGKFLANMSHEIREPLKDITGMSELLLETPLESDQRDYGKAVFSSGERILAIINDILDLSKIEAQELVLKLIDFDLPLLVEKVAEDFAFQAQSKGLEIVALVGPDVPARVCGDPVRLQQILGHLVRNAIKFTEQGEVVIQVSLLVESPTGMRVEFKVSDTGIGIPPEQQSTLFEGFTQSNCASTRPCEGTGLALAISRQLAQLMGGDMNIVSRMGKGSTFSFTIHFTPAAERLRQSPVIEALDDLRVLIVDDNEKAREKLLKDLQSLGCLAGSAASSKQALQALQSATREGKPFRAVLVDQRMPGENSFQLGNRIQSESLFEETRLILLKTLWNNGDDPCQEEANFQASLVKPVRRAALITCLVELFCDMPEITPHLENHPPHFPHAPTPALRILLADDNEVNQRVATRILERVGHQVIVAGNGLEAVELQKSQSFDLILMDTDMPVMSGEDAVREIRAREEGSGNHIPILALAAHARNGEDSWNPGTAMDDTIRKPIKAVALLEALEKWAFSRPPMDKALA